MHRFALAAVVTALCGAPLAAQPARQATAEDLLRLDAALKNLEAELEGLEPGDRTTEFRRRAETISEEAIFLRVKMRRHQETGAAGSGVEAEEVEALEAQVRALRDDLDRAFGAPAGDVRVPVNTVLAIRLGVPLSSRTARLEDRFEAALDQPVRVEGQVALPAGAQVRGVVRAVERAERPSKPGRLELEFDALYLEGSRFELRVQVDAIREQGKQAEKAGIGAVIGGVLGGVLAGKTGAIVGVLLGGTGAVVGTKGEDVELPVGTVLTVRLVEPLVVPAP